MARDEDIQNIKPGLRFLSSQAVEEIYHRALKILEESGVKFYCSRALDLLQKRGAVINHSEQTAKFPSSLVREALKTAPSRVELYTLEGRESVVIGGDHCHFVPGSAALNILEADGETLRRARAEDLVKIARLNDSLAHIALQSSAVVLDDVPDSIGDSYRLYLLLKNSLKPIITGAFSRQGIEHMHGLLAAVSGGEEELREKPRAVFDVCPSPPLKWSEISSHNIIDCARLGLPLQMISLPMPGAASPVTLAGSVLLHTAEVLSGLVLAQVVNPGLPVIYGGAPVNFDMKTGTTPMSAVEASMIGASSSQLGRYLDLPTQTYACLSDAKIVDAQAGLETAISGTIASLAETNLISGPGILDFVDTFSLEKLVIDNEICGMSRRLARGIEVDEERLAASLISELGPGGSYLTSEHTLKYFRNESYFPGEVIDRTSRSDWTRRGKSSIFTRAGKVAASLLSSRPASPLPEERLQELKRGLTKIKKEYNIDKLPEE